MLLKKEFTIEYGMCRRRYLTLNADYREEGEIINRLSEYRNQHYSGARVKQLQECAERMCDVTQCSHFCHAIV